jgi:hypothetical protein
MRVLEGSVDFARLSSLCLLALNNNAQAQSLTLPTGTITAPAVDDETVSLNAPTAAGLRNYRPMPPSSKPGSTISKKW